MQGRRGWRQVCRATPHDVPPGPVRVVLFGSKAAELAKSPEVLEVLHSEAPGGRQWELLPVDSGQNWGAASTQLFTL